MKILSRSLSTILVIAMMLGSLLACSGKNNDDKNGEKDSETEYSKYIDISEYKIIRSYSGGDYLRNSVVSLKNIIKKNVGVDIPVRVDLDAEPTDKEIIIGGQNKREEAKRAYDYLLSKVDKEAYLITVEGSKIIIVGLSEEDTIMGINHFVREFVEKSPVKGRLALEAKDTKIAEQTGSVIYKNSESKFVVVQRYTTVAVPEDIMRGDEFTYGKIIKLEHQADDKNNGILIATAENTSQSPWSIYHSENDGSSWKKVTEIDDTVNPDMNPGYQPYLFELPEDVGEYKKGSIIFSGCSYGAGATKFPIFISSDQGKTWTALGNIAVGGAFNGQTLESEGIWEPVFAYENGKLYCFYSDEQDPKYNQRLVYKSTSDLKKWSEPVNVTAYDTEKYRPGMVALTKMGNGKWALAYELVGADGNGIRIKQADTLESWDVFSDGKLAYIHGVGRYLGSAPAIAWTPEGGECGTLFLTANHNAAGGSGTTADLYMSYDYGETWTSIRNPINVQRGSGVRCGYSAGMYVDKEGSLYYVNNEVYSEQTKSGKLMFVKIKIF